MALTYTDHAFSAMATAYAIGGPRAAPNRQLQYLDLLTAPLAADTAPATPPSASGYVGQRLPTLRGDGIAERAETSAAVVFGPATANWPQVTHLGLWGSVRSRSQAMTTEADSISGWSIQLPAPVTIASGSSYTIPIGGLAFDLTPGASGRPVTAVIGTDVSYVGVGRFENAEAAAFESILGGILSVISGGVVSVLFLTKEPTLTDWGIPFEAFNGIPPSVGIVDRATNLTPAGNVGNPAATFGPTSAAVTLTHYAIATGMPPMFTADRTSQDVLRRANYINSMQAARIVAWDALPSQVAVGSGGIFTIPENSIKVA